MVLQYHTKYSDITHLTNIKYNFSHWTTTGWKVVCLIFWILSTTITLTTGEMLLLYELVWTSFPDCRVPTSVTCCVTESRQEQNPNIFSIIKKRTQIIQLNIKCSISCIMACAGWVKAQVFSRPSPSMSSCQYPLCSNIYPQRPGRSNSEWSCLGGTTQMHIV